MSATQPESHLCFNPDCPNIDDLEEQKDCMPVECGRCRKTMYCSQLCQSVHSTVQNQVCGKSPTGGPYVILLSLSNPDMLARIHGQFISALRSKVRIIQALNAQKALKYLALADTNLKGVVVADEGIAEEKNSEVLSSLIKWVNAGGIAIIGCVFPSLISFTKFDPFFEKWGLPWTMGDYCGMTSVLNPLIRQSSRHSVNLMASYSTKAVHLKGVKVEDILYAHTREEEEDEYEDEDSSAQSRAFPPLMVNLSNVPVAYTRVGRGSLGYVGDVNAEEGSTSAILAMLRL